MTSKMDQFLNTWYFENVPKNQTHPYKTTSLKLGLLVMASYGHNEIKLKGKSIHPFVLTIHSPFEILLGRFRLWQVFCHPATEQNWSDWFKLMNITSKECLICVHVSLLAIRSLTILKSRKQSCAKKSKSVCFQSEASIWEPILLGSTTLRTFRLSMPSKTSIRCAECGDSGSSISWVMWAGFLDFSLAFRCCRFLKLCTSSLCEFPSTLISRHSNVLTFKNQTFYYQFTWIFSTFSEFSAIRKVVLRKLLLNI